MLRIVFFDLRAKHSERKIRSMAIFEHDQSLSFLRTVFNFVNGVNDIVFDAIGFFPKPHVSFFESETSNWRFSGVHGL